MTTLSCRFLGRVPYARASELQERLVAARRSGEAPDTLLLLEHPPVVTLGRGAHTENLLLDAAALSARGIEVHEAGRGGDVTFHGPGQLVGYPVVALLGARRDAHRYLRDLEEGLLGAVEELGVRGSRVPGLTGVWAGGNKLAAIGVRIGTGWITSHGFALNVGDDLSGFETIVPCGIRGRGVTSLARETGAACELESVARVTASHVAKALGLAAVWDGTISSPSARRESA